MTAREVLELLEREAVLNANDYGDNVSVTIPIELWRKAWEVSE